MICPECGDEYREGFAECAYCHVALVEPSEPAPGGEMADDAGSRDREPYRGALVVVAECWMSALGGEFGDDALAILELEAQLAEQGLDAAFDPARPGDGASYTRSIGTARPVRLLVREDEADRARQVARELGLERLLKDET